MVLHSIDLGPDAGGEPVLADGVVLVAEGRALSAYDLRSGAKAWTAAGAQLPATVIDGQVVLEAAEQIEARDARTGTVRWTSPVRGRVVHAWQDTGIALMAGGAVTLLEPDTGLARWKVELPCRPEPNQSAVSSRHVLVGCASRPNAGDSDVLRALALSTGEQEWLHPVGALGRTVLDGDVPAVHELNVAGGLDPDTGEERWSVPTDRINRYAPFVDMDKREAFRRDPITGRELPGRVPASYGAAASGDLLVGADGNTLTAVRAGDKAWTSPLPQGLRPSTLLDVDEQYVVSLTSVGQPRTRD